MRRWLLLTGWLLGTSAAFADSPPLRLGTNLWPGYEPLYLAADRYSWSEELNVRMLEYPSASAVLRAFRNGTLEAAALTLDEALMLLEAGLPIHIISVLDISDGGDVVLAQSEFGSFTELKGQRIGVESSALGAYVLSRALQLEGMNLTDITVVHMNVSEHETAFQEHRIDAVVTFDPIRTRLLADGARMVFDSRQIPGEIVDVLVVHEHALSERRAQLRQLIAEWSATLEYMRGSPEAAASFTGERLGITTSEAIASLDGLILPDDSENRRLLTGGLDLTLQRLHSVLLGENLLLSPVDTKGLLVADLLPE